MPKFDLTRLALKAFIQSEQEKDAGEGLACEVAMSLLAEARAEGAGCLEKLPPLKQAILDYVLELHGNT